MVRRFRRLTRYPSDYSSLLADDQSAVPSQHSPVPPAFDPGHQPDMIPTPIRSTPDVSIVRHTFDSRPPFTYDFFFEDAFLDGINQLNGYVVPIGYVLILRKVVVSVYPAFEADRLNSPVMTAFGDLDVSAFPSTILHILINDAPAPTWTVGNVLLFDIFTSDVEIDTFILVQGGDRINISITNITSPDGVATTTFNTYVHYYGNMLLSTGRNLVNEVGNQYPQPVVEVNAQ